MRLSQTPKRKVNGQEQFYETGKSTGGISSNLPDPSHRSKKPPPRDFCPKVSADSPHPSLRAQDREDLKWLRRLLVCICCPRGTRGYLEGKRDAYCGEQTRKTRLSISKPLEAVQLPKKVAAIHCKGRQKGGAEVIKRNNKVDATAKRAGPRTSNLVTTPQTLKARTL